MRTLDVEQGGPEWFAARCGIATASRFSDVLAKIKNGESAERRKYRSMLVVERLTGRATKTAFESPAMRAGMEREPIARALYEYRRNVFVDQVGICLHDEGFAGASPDGLIGDDGGLEIKAPEHAAHLDYLRLPANVAPAKYVAQIQGCMWITGRAWWDFASFHPEFPEHLQLIVRRIPRDEGYVLRLEAEVRGFMEEVLEEEAEVRALPAAA